MAVLQLKNSLRPWQLDALESWRANGQRGIIAAATGTGKTMVALAAIAEFDAAAWRVMIVVPKINLMGQWLDCLHGDLGIPPRDVGTIGGTAPSFEYRHRLLVAVLASARDRLPPIAQEWHRRGLKNFLIVDECHWAGSERSAELFTAPRDATLGLSATPERRDDGFDEVLVPGLGEVIYRYRLRDALDDGVLAPLTSVNVYVDLSKSELFEYQALSRRLESQLDLLREDHPNLTSADLRPAVLNALLSPQHAKSLETLLAQRRRLVANSQERLPVLAKMIELGLFVGRRTLVFNETIKQAAEVHRLLIQAGIAAEVEHSSMSASRRTQAFKRFSTGLADALVVVRTTDEGIDVPEANFALILSGTLTARQRIQRIGRVVRPAGDRAHVVSVLARGTAEEFEVGWGDAELLGTERVRHLVWSEPGSAHQLRNEFARG